MIGVNGDEQQRQQQKVTTSRPVEAAVAPNEHVMKAKRAPKDQRNAQGGMPSSTSLPPSVPSLTPPLVVAAPAASLPNRVASERHEAYQRRQQVQGGDSGLLARGEPVAASAEASGALPLSHEGALALGSRQGQAHGPESSSPLPNLSPPPTSDLSTRIMNHRPNDVESALPALELPPAMPSLSLSDLPPSAALPPAPAVAAVAQGRSLEALRERAQMALRAAAAASDASQRAAASSAAASVAASR